MKYANDLLLTDLARRLKNELSSLDAYMTDGNLDAAFLRAMTLQRTVEGLMWRLNDIKYGRV
jgi:hypothetical protein